MASHDKIQRAPLSCDSAVAYSQEGHRGRSNYQPSAGPFAARIGVKPMNAQQTFVAQLLRHYHRGKPAEGAQYALPTAGQVDFLCSVGLGPIAFRVYGDEFRRSDPTIFSVLQSADMTTRVIYGQLERAAVELAGRLRDIDVCPIFLKGISTAHEFYEPSYLRVMADIDILIRPSQVDHVMAEVEDLGYQIEDEQWRHYQAFGHHHLPAARNPGTGVMIEVHTGLFGAAEFYSREPVFQSDSFTRQSIGCDFRGIPIARFTPEFQFIFTVSKWSVDDDWAVNLTGINDAVHILRKYESHFDWQTMSRWLAANPHLIPIITALLQYLEQAGIVRISSELRKLLAGTGRQPGKRVLQLLAWLLHEYPFNAGNKVYGGYTRWRAHSLWLYLTRPSCSDSGIPMAVLRAMLRSAKYGRYNPLIIVPYRLKRLIYRARR